MKKILSSLILLALTAQLLAGCGQDRLISPTASRDAESTDPVLGETTLAQTDSCSPAQTDSSPTYREDEAVQIRLNGDSAEASSDSVRTSGSTVIIQAEATYVICGSLTGMVVVDAPEDARVQLILSGADITSQSSAALYIREADQVIVNLAQGTENYLTNGGEFTPVDDSNIDATLFSRTDLTLTGDGALTVTAPAGHGIVCKDDLAINGGAYTLNAAAHGLDANDSILISGGDITIDAGKDAIHCENSDDGEKGSVCISGGAIHAEAEGDGVSASADLQITGGALSLLAGGGSENGTQKSSGQFGGFMGGGPGGGPGGRGRDTSQDAEAEEDSTSMKGLKSATAVQITGGSITVNSADDAIHSNGNITVQGGVFNLASGDDAIHADDTLTVQGGEITVSESYEGLEALHIRIQGGQIRLVAADDGLNAAGGTDSSGAGGRDGMFGGGMWSGSNGSITISSGTLCINASGDGIDANGSLEISGGYTVVAGPTQGDTATLDYDTSATITGGTFIGTGASGMAQSFSDSTQGVVAVRVGNQAAGTVITLTDEDGNTLLCHEPELAFSVVILSSPDVVKGETFTITVGAQSGSFEAS